MVEKIVIRSQQPARRRQWYGVFDDVAIDGEQPASEYDDHWKQEDPLIPTQDAGSKLHDRAEEQTSEGRNRHHEPCDKEEHPVSVDIAGRELLLISHESTCRFCDASKATSWKYQSTSQELSKPQKTCHQVDLLGVLP